MALRSVFEYTFSLSGAGTTNVELDPIDLSRARAIRCYLKITAAATAAGDTLAVRFQETKDGIVWDTRARHTAQVGNSAASATAPETETLVILCRGYPQQSSERVWEESGSGGGTDLSAGTTRNGPMVPRRRSALGTAAQPRGGLLASHRVQFVTVQTGTVAYTGTYVIEADTGDA